MWIHMIHLFIFFNHVHPKQASNPTKAQAVTWCGRIRKEKYYCLNMEPENYAHIKLLEISFHKLIDVILHSFVYFFLNIGAAIYMDDFVSGSVEISLFCHGVKRTSDIKSSKSWYPLSTNYRIRIYCRQNPENPSVYDDDRHLNNFVSLNSLGNTLVQILKHIIILAVLQFTLCKRQKQAIIVTYGCSHHDVKGLTRVVNEYSFHDVTSKVHLACANCRLRKVITFSQNPCKYSGYLLLCTR